MRIILQIIGALALAMGLLWTLQGAGVVHWPVSSFMLDQRPWIARGLLLMGVGALALYWSRRRRPLG